jgi:putative ABC transport system permease protein
MRALNVKLLRDLWQARAQVASIALVVAIGVGGFVGLFSVHASLLQARDDFYADNRFADVFAGVRRAPLALAVRLAELPGVAEVKVELVFDVQVDLDGAGTPVTGRFIGLELARAQAGRQGLNALSLRSGRWPEPGAALEAVVSDRFAVARGLTPGDEVHAILGGRRERVRVVGTVVTPEYVFATRGAAPDDLAFGVWWIDQRRMQQAFGMHGAFNQVALRLHAGVPAAPVIAAVDRLLEPYGTPGALGRARQLSAQMVQGELDALRVLGSVLPAIFLAVAVFILHGVLARLVTAQRGQIAALKALGYRDGEIGVHYVGYAVVIAALGIVAGLALSAWIGRAMLGLYDEVFRFERLGYATEPWVVGAATLAAAGAAALGAWTAIRAVVRLAPAQAMRPPAPAEYRPTLLERAGFGRQVSAGWRMVLRQIEQRPLRAALTTLGIALAVALQIAGAFWIDAIDHVIDTQFRQVQQGDVLLDFDPPQPLAVRHDLRRLPGVLDAEVYRVAPVRVALRGRSDDTGLTGLAADAQLLRVVDARRGPVAMPAHGVVMSALLAEALGARVGDRVQIEFRLWRRARVEVEVVDIADTLLGRQMYMELAAMNRLAGDGAGVNAAALQIDPREAAAFWAAVRQAPGINAVFDKAASLATFEAQTARTILVFSLVQTLFAVALAVGITYNAARIALSERAWELASLRVLGMTRAEVSVLLLAELAMLLALALPLGALLGWALATLLMALMATEQISLPVIIEPSTYAASLLIVLAAAGASALLVRRHIDRLDLIAVLKVRE